MKKIAFFVLPILILLMMFVTIYASSFADVAEDDYYAGAAERMAARGIIVGYEDGLYHGERSLTRAQMATLACKMLGKADEAAALAGKTVFSDVNEDGWYCGYINYAVANGIVVGDGNGKFRPDDMVKYEEAVKVVLCVIGRGDGIRIDSTDWSKEYLKRADELKITQNLVGKKGEYMVRGDIAVLCDAALALVESEEAGRTSTTKKQGGNSRPSSPVRVPETTTETESEASQTTTFENQLPAIPF